MLQVHIETLKISGKGSYKTGKGKTAKTVEYDMHSIEVTIAGDRREVRCHPSDKNVSVFGLAVKFQTGEKIWPASAIYWIEKGTVNNIRPNIDKFSGQNCRLVGYMSDFEQSSTRSMHNAVA